LVELVELVALVALVELVELVALVALVLRAQGGAGALLRYPLRGCFRFQIQGSRCPLRGCSRFQVQGSMFEIQGLPAPKRFIRLRRADKPQAGSKFRK
jgi:hypothetical protein